MSTIYKWKTRPYHHQVEAVKQAIRQLDKTGGFALLMEPRTGKTKTAIDIASILHLRGDVNRVIVLCPVGVVDVWVDEIRLHCPYKWRITIWDRDGRKEVDLPKMGQDVLDFVIVNYDAFSTPGAVMGKNADGSIKRSRTRGGRFALKKSLINWNAQLIIADESHRLKSPSARKVTTIASVVWNIRDNTPKIPYRLLLTGTVLTKRKRVFDIYSQWKNFLNRRSPLVRNVTIGEFKEKYAVWTTRNGYPQWLRNKPKAEANLRRLLHAESFAVTRDECYDLPPRLPPVLHYVELEESAALYDEMAAELVATLESGEITWAKIPLVQRTRLRQISNGVAKTEPSDEYPEGRVVRIGREKLRLLEDLLIDQFEAEEKIVIGAQYRADIAACVEVVKKMPGKIPIYELHGGVDKAQRTANIKAFREHEGAAVFIMQPSAGSLGIDLSTAGTIIWYSMTDSWVDYTQANDRIALSQKATRYIYLLARGTIDEMIYESMQEDGDVAKRITESPQRLLRNFKNEKVARK